MACSPSGERATSPPLCRLACVICLYVDFDIWFIVCDSNAVLVFKSAPLLFFFLGNDGCYVGSMSCASAAGFTGDKHRRLGNRRPCTEPDSMPSRLLVASPFLFSDLLELIWMPDPLPVFSKFQFSISLCFYAFLVAMIAVVWRMWSASLPPALPATITVACRTGDHILIQAVCLATLIVAFRWFLSVL